MLYPQNGDRIVAINSVTSLHPVYMFCCFFLFFNDSCQPVGFGGSIAEWLACWTQAQKGLGSNRSRDAVG